jgi:hypothetical protein
VCTIILVGCLYKTLMFKLEVGHHHSESILKDRVLSQLFSVYITRICFSVSHFQPFLPLLWEQYRRYARLQSSVASFSNTSVTDAKLSLTWYITVNIMNSDWFLVICYDLKRYPKLHYQKFASDKIARLQV